MKHLFAQLSKVTEQPDGTCIVRGRMTAEELDKSNEILDYAKSKPQIEKWRDETLAASGGKSLGNIRAMHGKVAAGIATNIYFDDANKAVDLESHIVDLQEAKKCVAGVYTGYSIGGGYAERWPDEAIKGAFRFVPTMVETSLVDKPCVASAVFSYVKADGTTEMRKFVDPPKPTAKDRLLEKFGTFLDAELGGLTKGVKHLVTESTGVEHLPYTDAEGKPDHNHMGAAWAALHDGYRGNKYQGPDKDKAIATLKNVYESEGMKTPDAQKALLTATLVSLTKRAKGKLEKGLWDVSRLADALQTLAFLQTSLEDTAVYRDSDTAVPDKLRALLIEMKPLFIELATEEINELIREEEAEKAAQPGTLAKGSTTPGKEAPVAEKNEKLLELQKAAKGGVAKAMTALGKAQASHEKMGDHIDAMQKACKAFEVGDLAKSELAIELRKGLVTSIQALRDEHGKMEDHHDNIEEELQDLAESANEESDTESAGDSKKAREAIMRKRITREVKKDNAKLLEEVEKSRLETAQMFQGMTAVLEKMAGAAFGAPTPGTAAAPARTAISVEKAADVTGAVTIHAAVPGASAAAAGPHLVKAVLADGMPNPEYVNSSAAERGDAFIAAASKVQPQHGDPFPAGNRTLLAGVL